MLPEAAEAAVVAAEDRVQLALAKRVLDGWGAWSGFRWSGRLCLSVFVTGAHALGAGESGFICRNPDCVRNVSMKAFRRLNNVVKGLVSMFRLFSPRDIAT